jgi:signal transduction histidine kinase/ActR/RegA family two-component response regulator
MGVWAKVPERWRLVIVLTGALALLIGGVSMAFFNERLAREQKARDVGVQAQILAASVSAGLAFDDKPAVQEYVDAMGSNPEIQSVRVFDDKNVEMARLNRAKPVEGPSLSVTRPVVQGATRLGRVELRIIVEPTTRRLSRVAGVALLVIMASLLLAVMGAAQAAQARANATLAERAEDLAEANRLLEIQIEERAKAEEALRQSQKMEAIGQLTGGVAHDFNNLLMIASGGMDLLDRSDDPVRRQKLKDGIRQALGRGADLVRQLLAFSRRTALKPEVIDLGQRIEGMRILLDRSLRENLTVTLELSADLWPVEADASELELAILNLAVNARDAMPAGGSIVIRAENAPNVERGGRTGDFVRLSVTDTGEGMTADVISRVFEPYFTTKAVGKGTGLGLSQVYGFCRASGGEVRIDSAPGEGATVSLYLPRSDKPAAQKLQERVRRRVRAGHGRILLVEDDDGVAALVGEMLSELGYEPTRAPTVNDALRAFDDDPDFDLILSDMVMPGELNGLDLARAVWQRREGMPILLTTGYSEAAATATAEGLRVLLKPYRIEALAAELEAVRAEARRLHA